MKPCELSVVVPVYGCVGCLQTLYERLSRSLEGISEWEVVFVDDASPDGAWDALERLAARDERVRALRLSRLRPTGPPGGDTDSACAGTRRI
jgi:polyisoprenyl-phosphate glycosyltransferase